MTGNRNRRHGDAMFTADLPIAPLFTPLPDGIGIAALMLLALLIDRLAGDPAILYRWLPHPVVLIGRAVSLCERRYNRVEDTPRRQMIAGAASWLLIVGGCAALTTLIIIGLRMLPYGWVIEVLFASTLLAGRSLRDHVAAVQTGLVRSTEAGRLAVGHIVGRDTTDLDPPAIARAAIESAAENFSDGVVAPLFWFALFGLPGMAAYKAVNTLDSMIGYRTARHLYFGRIAARADDLANWVPARITGLLFCLAAASHRRTDAGNAWRVMRRDARNHASPNAGWPEAAMAGALTIALGGPRSYPGGVHEAAWLGAPGHRTANGTAIAAALALTDRTILLLMACTGLVAVAMFFQAG